MPKICYVDKKFNAGSREIIDLANTIITTYRAQGLTLTLRQLYYRFISRDFFPNTEQSYKRLGNVLNDARLAGLVDWDAIEDRTRSLKGYSHWANPNQIIRGSAYSYRIDKWVGQANRVQVWVEKDALVSIVGRAASKWDVDYFACRGYVSQSEMWEASQRMLRYSGKGQNPIIIHLGDHDPSGIDMTRDIKERLAIFADHHFADRVHVKRIALNYDQVEEYNPPPNPAKSTDSRFRDYQDRFGDDSWELDALEPSVLNDLIEATILEYLDVDLYNQRLRKEQEEKVHLEVAAEQWASMVEHIEETHGALVANKLEAVRAAHEGEEDSDLEEPYDDEDDED